MGSILNPEGGTPAEGDSGIFSGLFSGLLSRGTSLGSSRQLGESGGAALNAGGTFGQTVGVALQERIFGNREETLEGFLEHQTDRLFQQRLGVSLEQVKGSTSGRNAAGLSNSTTKPVAGAKGV